jgi:hypothetical protein
MDDWMIWLVVFLGFATALAIGVAVIAVHILSSYAARRRNRIERFIAATAEIPRSFIPEACDLCAAHAFSGACRWSGCRVRGHASSDGTMRD